MFSGIKVLDRGDTIPESAIPLDINYKKILEWLVDRKQIANNWNTELEILEKEIKYATSILPKDEPFISLQKQELWYSRIEQILNEVQKQEKGWTGSSLGRAWRKVMNHLKKNHLFLAHSSRLLLTYTNYEIIAVNKQLERLGKQIADSKRKGEEYKKIAANEKALFKSDCEKIGIPGENIHEELLQLVSELPRFVKKIEEVTKQKETFTALQFYHHFCLFVAESDTDSSTSSSSQHDDQSHWVECPVLHHVLQFGNETLAVMQQRKDGTYVESEVIGDSFVMVPDSPARVIDSDVTNIDDDDVAMGAPGEINWDIDVPDSDVVILHPEDDVPLAAAGGIEWGDDKLGLNTSISWDYTEETDEINIDEPQWEINLEDIGLENEPTPTDEDTTQTQSSLTANESILVNSRTRNLFLDDLLELQAFLEQRVVEMEIKDNLVMTNIFQTAPAEINKFTYASVCEIRDHIQNIIHLLNDSNFRMIIQIKASARFAERISKTIKHRMEIANRMLTLSAELALKLQEMEEHVSQLQAQRVILLTETKEIKTHIETELSKIYKRPINITGDINNII